MMKTTNLFTFDEVARLTGITRPKFRSLIKKELINFYKLGGRIYFDLVDLLEIKAIANLNLSPNQIREIREFFDENKLSKSFSNKRLIVTDKTIYMVNNLDDITQITNNGRGQKIIGQILLPDLYSEMREQARVINLENYSKKFNRKIA